MASPLSLSCPLPPISCHSLLLPPPLLSFTFFLSLPILLFLFLFLLSLLYLPFLLLLLILRFLLSSPSLSPRLPFLILPQQPGLRQPQPQLPVTIRSQLRQLLPEPCSHFSPLPLPPLSL